jgi:tetratricopeptide (TPR) repeat protein
LNKRTGEEVMKAIASFGRAVELDSSFALPYAGLAEGYTLAGGAGYGSLPRELAIERARSFAQKAIALDDTLADAHAALAYMKFRIDWDWAGAEADFKRALALKPGYARAHEWYALFLAIQRRLPAALTEMQLAWRFDPLSPSVSNGVGRILHFQRRFEEAVRQFEKTLALDPAYAEAYFSLGITYGQLGRYDEAIKALEAAIRLSGRRQVMVTMLGFTYALAGRRDEAQKIREELVAQSKTTHVSPYHFGLIAFGLGNADVAMEYFERALDEKDGILIYLPVDPLSEKLWSHPRYAALLEKMNLAK